MIFVMGSVQAWDSNVPSAGVLIVLLVSFAIALPAVAIFLPIQQVHYFGLMIACLVLLVIARLLAPVELPGLYIIMVPVAIGYLLINALMQRSSKID